MYGDTEVIRRRTRQLREQSGELRRLGDGLVARLESSPWSGRAAKSMWLRVTERAAQLHEVAAEHDRAADSLDAHLRAVEHVGELIAARQRRAELLVADAQVRVGSARHARGPAGGVVDPDPQDRELVAFTPPPPGHLDWLEVELPGLAAADS